MLQTESLVYYAKLYIFLHEQVRTTEKNDPTKKAVPVYENLVKKLQILRKDFQTYATTHNGQIIAQAMVYCTKMLEEVAQNHVKKTKWTKDEIEANTMANAGVVLAKNVLADSKAALK